MKLRLVTDIAFAAFLAITCSCAKESSSTIDDAPALAVRPPTAPADTAPADTAPVDVENESTWTPLRSADYPDVPTGLPVDLPLTAPGDDYLVLAWNDLGMHCYQADFSRFQILPPYNVFWCRSWHEAISRRLSAMASKSNTGH